MRALPLRKIADAVNLRSERERLLIISGILLTLYITASYIIQPKLSANLANVRNETALIQTLIGDRNLAIQKTVQAHNQRTNLGTQKKIEQLNRQINQFSDKLSDISRSFVDANEMTSLMMSILSEHKLKLQQLENAPPEAITKNIQGLANIYKHGLYLEVTGSYDNHIHFLERLKQLPWNIFWKELHLQDNKPGQATVSLSMYTLSYSPVWLEL